MNASDDYCVRDRALSSLEALRFGRGNIYPQRAFVLEQVGSLNPQGRAREHCDVGREEGRLTGFESLRTVRVS